MVLADGKKLYSACIRAVCHGFWNVKNRENHDRTVPLPLLPLSLHSGNNTLLWYIQSVAEQHQVSSFKELSVTNIDICHWS